MAPVITFIQIVLFLGGLAATGLGPIGWLIGAGCAAIVVALQSKKVAKLDPKFKALMADPVNRRRGRRQATVLALGVIGFGTFCTLDAFGHIDTTGLSGKDALFAAIVALLFVTGGLYYTRRR